jgi:hypothetical protein
LPILARLLLHKLTEVTTMKTLIIAAALVSSFAFVVTHAHARAHVTGAAPAMAATAEATPAILYVPEQTIIVDNTPVTHAVRPAARPAVRAHVETDAEHVMRLMTATPEMVSCAACTPRKPFESMSGRVSHLGDR